MFDGILNIFEEEPEPEPEPEPTTGEKLKAAAAAKKEAIAGVFTGIKETYEYKKKQRKVKKAFKGIGEEDTKSDKPVVEPSGPYQFDEFCIVPLSEPVNKAGYEHHDIDYWKSFNKPGREGKVKREMTFRKQSTGTSNDNWDVEGKDRKKSTLLRSKSTKNDTLGRQSSKYDTLGRQSSKSGTLGRKSTLGRQATLDRRTPHYQYNRSKSVYDSPQNIEWEHLSNSGRNVYKSTGHRKSFPAAKTKSSSSSSSGAFRTIHTAADLHKYQYDERASLHTNQIHWKARPAKQQRQMTAEEAARYLPPPEKRQQEERHARGFISAASACSQAVVGVCQRIKITRVYGWTLCFGHTHCYC